jgi:hypothetical protein
MSVPLKKSNLEEELTTADLAQSKRPAVPAEMRPRPVPAEAAGAEHPETSSVSSQAVGDATPLIPNSELDDLRGKWNTVQTAFVDEPRRAVEQADGLVAAAMKRLAEVFAEERGRLEKQWDRGDNVSTEDLRVALQRYRSFFHRLLSI